MSASTSGFVHRRLRILVPLRHRDFRLLWSGMTVSLLGDGITTIALAWQAYEISDAPTAFSMVMFSMAVPQVVLLLVGGAVSDRFDRRKVMLAADLVRMVAVFALGTLALTGHIQIWHMMIIAALYGCGTAFFGPAFDAIVPDLVPAEELTQANSLDQFVRPAVYRMLGPAVGGWLIALFGTPGDAFIVDGFTFAVSVACLLMMRPHRPAADEESASGSMIGEIKEGLRYVRKHTWLWGTLLAASLTYLIFLGPAEVLLPLLVKRELGGSPSELGLILALGGVGAMGSAVVMGNREMPKRHITFMYVAWTLSTLAVAGYGFARGSWHAMVFCFTFNALESAGLIVWITTKQRLVPPRLLGRVSSFDWFISTALVPVSYAMTGPVAQLLGTRPTLIGAGVVGAAVTFAFLFLPGMREIERAGTLAGVHLDAALGSGPDGHVGGDIPPDDRLADVVPLFVPAIEASPNGDPRTKVAAAETIPPESDGTIHPYARNGRDPAVDDAFRRIAELRAALERWKAARAVVEAALAVPASSNGRGPRLEAGSTGLPAAAGDVGDGSDRGPKVEASNTRYPVA